MPTSPWRAHLADEADFEPGSLSAGGNLGARWAKQWRARPSATVLSFPAGAPGGLRLDGCELDERSAAVAAALQRLGLRRGERLLWSTASSPEAVLACLGALRLGAVVVPVNRAYTGREVGHIVDDVTPAVAVVERPEQGRWVTESEGGRACVVVPPSLEGAPATGGAAGEVVLDEVDGGDPALIVFTSGTTGAPKGAVLSHANVLAGAAALRLAWRWSGEDGLVLSLPLFHVHGLCAGLFGTLCAGASASVLDGFEVEGVLDSVRSEGSTMFFGVPTMYHRLVGSGRARELARLRLCVSGSAPLPVELWRRAQALGTELLERYGMTETLLTVSNPYEGERRPGTVGFPLPGVEVRLADPSSGSGSDDGGGALFVRGPSVFGGYWRRPAATEEAFEEGGWFRTGDLVSSDPDGYLRIRGRRQDLIISGGYNVYPTEVEDVLLAHPAVAEVAVTGAPSAEWGETVVAWVVPGEEGFDEGAVLAFAAQRLAPYKRPRALRLVEALPRNPLGKVLRRELR